MSNVRIQSISPISFIINDKPNNIVMGGFATTSEVIAEHIYIGTPIGLLLSLTYAEEHDGSIETIVGESPNVKIKNY